jgi:Uma2 family endonuclease
MTTLARPANSSITLNAIAPITVRQYQQMIAHGILTPADQVELLEHWVVQKMPKSPEHEGTLDLLGAALRAIVPSGWLIRMQQAIVLADSQPEPDFAIVRGNARSFLTRHPGVEDVAVVIEVAGSSLLRDQRDKGRIYARAGLPVYWVVNLEVRQIEVYSQPSGPTAPGQPEPAYGAMTAYSVGQQVPLQLEQQTFYLAVADCLP